MVSTWHATPDDAMDAEMLCDMNRARSEAQAQRDLDDLHRADALRLFHDGQDGRGGRDVETGDAYALGKTIHLIGPRHHILHTLPTVAWWNSLNDWLAAYPAYNADGASHAPSAAPQARRPVLSEIPAPSAE